MSTPSRDETLLEKLRGLPAERRAEVEVIDFLRDRDEDRRLVQAAMKLSEGPLEKVWDNPDDAANFDKL
jgi:hypothetical protein